MRFAWVGFHTEGLPALEALLADSAPIQDVFTLRRDLSARRSGGIDYRPVCARYGVRLHQITNINEPPAVALLRACAPDVVFVIGWHQIVRPPTLRLARIGMIGAHASLLPHNRGPAPINWALIRGEERTGNTLFWLADDLDSGDIIAQRAFAITPYDTAASLYAQVAVANRDMLREVVPRLLAGERPGHPRPANGHAPLPRRRPVDGAIDWSQHVRSVYNFIRALTRPYPGAYGNLGGQRWRVWHAALPEPTPMLVAPGTVIGPVVSPIDEACGQLVACAEGALLLLELEAEHGHVLRGRELASQPWAGMRWENVLRGIPQPETVAP